MSANAPMLSTLPRILIVDDSRSVRATVAHHLDGCYQTREAGDGIQAWETLLVDPRIGLVITDLGMPLLDGYGLIQRIRASGIARINCLPVLVMSGTQDNAEHARAAAAGATGLIGKGASAAELLARLAVLMPAPA
jgi:two-component system cell cycle response regulator